MDPNLSLGKIFLGDNVIVISSDKVEGSRDWNSPEYQDTAISKGKKVKNALSFYRMVTDDISERYITPCFVNGLEAFDGEVNLAFDENLISNAFAVKLCLDYEVKKGKKLVKKELIVALKGELYFVKFIINHEEDDFEPGVILGRSFLRLAQGVVDFGNGVITIYPEPNPFEEESEKIGKSSDDWDQLLDFNFDDVPKSGEELPPFVCKTGKRNQEAAKEELAIRISQRYALLEEERHVIETMAYNDKYKKITDEIWKDKVELDGKTVKEDKEAVKRIKGEALKEKDDPGIEDMKKIDRRITMIDYTQAEAMGTLFNVLCQVGVTTIIAKFLILDIPIDRDAPIVVAARFDVLRTAESDSDDEEEYVIKRNKYRAPIYGPKPALYLNCTNLEDRSSAIQTTMGTNDDEAGSDAKSRYNTRLTQLLPGYIYSPCIVNWDVLNQMGCDGEIDDMLRIKVRETESEEEIFTSVAWIRAFNINESIYAEIYHEFYSTYEFDEVCANDELQLKKIIKFRLGGRAHSLTLLELARRLGLYQAVELEEDGFNVYFEGGLRNDDNFNAQDYWITGYDKVQKNDLWLLSMFDARHQNGDLDITTLRDLIDSDGKLIPEDPHGVA
ncbi:hypothetical protein Tco_0286119 [Tanacetum coccineum]